MHKKAWQRTNGRTDKRRQNNMPVQFHSKLGAWSGHLLIATNLFIKFQGSSFNSFLDILLTRETCPNLQSAITDKIFFRIYTKVNQVIYLPLPINSPSFKSLALTVFEIFCYQDKMPKITKGHNSISIFFKIYSKVNEVVYSSLQIHSPNFMALALTVFDIFCWQDKNDQNHIGP